MIVDLAAQDAERSIETDTLIVGGGIAGLLLACKLREHDIPVVVLESGGREQSEAVHPLNHVVQLGADYRGASEGRARCLGGTSTRWGGALIPFLASDCEARPHLDLSGWPVAVQDIEGYIPELETLFGVDNGPYDEAFARTAGPGVPVGDAHIMARFAKWPVFKKRNIATLFKERIEKDANLVVWLNATATTFECDEVAGRVSAVEARHIGGGRLQVAARTIILCAGAIESTRLLLLLDQQFGQRVFGADSPLGQYFHDHVTAPVAGIHTPNPRELNRLAGFRFAGSTMRSLRFELSPATQVAESVGSAFGHITFTSGGETGFDALQTSMRTLQRTGKFDVRAGAKLLRNARYMVGAAYWRYAYRQLRWPRPAHYQLHVVAEQTPHKSNRISLAAERDPFGCPLAAIDWHVTPAEHATIQAFTRHFEAYWKRHGLEAIGTLDWNAAAQGTAGASIAIDDVFHPGGTTRMGLDGNTAIVDRDLRTFAVPNLWVVSTSVFPSGASANPTMTLMLLALRLAEHLVEQRDKIAVPPATIRTNA